MRKLGKVLVWFFEKKSKKGVDIDVKVRYNGGSLSKSPFVTSTKRKESEGIF